MKAEGEGQAMEGERRSKINAKKETRKISEAKTDKCSQKASQVGGISKPFLGDNPRNCESLKVI